MSALDLNDNAESCHPFVSVYAVSRGETSQSSGGMAAFAHTMSLLAGRPGAQSPVAAAGRPCRCVAVGGEVGAEDERRRI